MARYLSAVWALTLAVTAVRAGDIGFIEDYALAKDKGAALKQLISGTEDYTTEQNAKAEAR